jgi:hypothetical protein
MMVYKPLPHYSIDEIKKIISTGTIEDMIILPLAVGENENNWKIAQDICVELSAHEDERVRSNAALGFAYIARTKGKLEKHIVRPILLKLLRECVEYKYNVIDAISDIKIFMKWNIGEKIIKRYENK